jgi:glycine cleavage system regulatory protein
MVDSLVFTVIGPDRPGLVGRLAATVAEYDGNWLESRMAVLAGHFAGVVLATVPEAKADALRRALMALEREGLSVVVEAAPGAAPPRAYRRVRLEVVGQDHPGIVRDIARALSERAVNIAEMETERSTAAMSAEAMFRLVADIELPETIATDELREALEVLAGDIMVEVDLAPEEAGPGPAERTV